MVDDNLRNFDDFGKKIRDLLSEILSTMAGVSKKVILKALIFGFLGFIIGFTIYEICRITSNVSSFLYFVQFFYFVITGAVLGVLFGLFIGAKKGLNDLLIGNRTLKAMIDLIVTLAVDNAYKAKDKSRDLASHIKEQLPLWLNVAGRDSKYPEESEIEPEPKPSKKKNCVLTIPFRLSKIIGNIITSRIAGLYKYVASDIAEIDFRNLSRENITEAITKVCVNKIDFLINRAIDQMFRQPLFLVYLLILVLIVLPFIVIVIF